MYTLYISNQSPYSYKASAMLGYAGFPCRINRETVINRYTVLKRLTGKTMVPVLRRGEWAINDSTSIARYVIEHGTKPLVPDEPGLQALCWLVEEFADEWMARWMVHSRWQNPEDARQVADAIGEEVTAGVPVVAGAVGRLAERFLPRYLARGGAREANRQALEQSRDRLLQGFEQYFDGRAGYLFGETPSVADFAVYGQLEQYRGDPSGGERMAMYPALAEWLDTMDAMRLPHPLVATRQGAEFRPEALQFVIAELLGTYWRMLLANLEARQAGEDQAEATLVDGTRFEFATSGYVEGRLGFVVEQFDRLLEHRGAVLEETGGGLAVESAIDDALERLAATPGGRGVLERARV